LTVRVAGLKAKLLMVMLLPPLGAAAVGVSVGTVIGAVVGVGATVGAVVGVSVGVALAVPELPPHAASNNRRLMANRQSPALVAAVEYFLRITFTPPKTVVVSMEEFPPLKGEYVIGLHTLPICL
jgi:hypothetical protein